MRWLFLVGSGCLMACGTAALESNKLKDGTWSFTCSSPMDECMRRVQETCALERFRIIEGVSETRARDAAPYEAAHTSRVRFECTNDGGEALFSFDEKKRREPKAPVAASTVCALGQTRECVGTAACRGGQICLPDGSGYGACDCGPTAPPAAASSAPVPSADAPPTTVSPPLAPTTAP